MPEAAFGRASTDLRRSAVLLLDAVARGSGLNELASALSGSLPDAWRVFTASSNEAPDIATVVRAIVSSGARRLVVVPVQPQYGATGTALAELYRALASHGAHLDVTVHARWHDDAGHVSALARHVAEHVSAHGLRPEETMLRLVAPGLPLRDPEDPCAGALRATVALVAERLGWPAHLIALEGDGAARPGDSPSAPPRTGSGGQGKGGANGGRPAGRPRDVLFCPVFSLDAICAADPGAHVCAPLHAFPPFVAALKRLVLKGPSPAGPGRKSTPLLRTRAAARRAAPARLIMLGASVPGALGVGEGPRLCPSDPEALVQVRKSHAELASFLDWLRESTPVREAFVWTTCQRVELYAWLPEPSEPGEDRALERRMRRALFGTAPEGVGIVVLDGRAARHHLLRTACGLNSDLPGDRDVAAQLLTALRRAQGAGTAATRAATLVEEAVALSDELVTETAWGRYAMGYCAAALRRVCEVEGIDPVALRHVTLGGSTTSRSVLASLTRDHRVPPHQLTAVYRDHHGQMKELRAALANGRRLKVHAYTDERVLGAIAGADLVVFGLDSPEPVLAARSLEDLRDFTARPLTLLDFNSRGSVDGPLDVPGVRTWSAADLDRAVATQAAITTVRDGFADALGDAESRIGRHVLARAELGAARPTAMRS